VQPGLRAVFIDLPWSDPATAGLAPVIVPREPRRGRGEHWRQPGALSDIVITMTRVFKTRHFCRWMRRTELTDQALWAAVSEMRAGLIDADLGGGVMKKRVPLPRRGKSGSTRTLVATNRGDRWFFLFGFQKNERANVSARELEALQGIAADLLRLSSAELNAHVESEALQEICHDCQD